MDQSWLDTSFVLFFKNVSFCEVPFHIRSHSFRIGRATEMAKNRVDEETIKLCGRWISDSYLRYIRIWDLSRMLQLRIKLYFYLGSKSIWFLGSSIVYCGEKKALSRAGGLHLGLQNRGVNIRWFGKRGILWSELVATVEKKILFTAPVFISNTTWI